MEAIALDGASAANGEWISQSAKREAGCGDGRCILPTTGSAASIYATGRFSTEAAFPDLRRKQSMNSKISLPLDTATGRRRSIVLNTRDGKVTSRPEPHLRLRPA